jgi:SAM-dependent methyltransferase
MALSKLMLQTLLEGIKPGQAIVSLGYPDIIPDMKLIREKLGVKSLELKYREDSEKICKRHGLPMQDIPDSESLFELLGCTLDVFDVVQERGCEVLVDLNKPIPENACGQFDWVLDVGTMEHCFNAPQALVNIAALAKVGGCVLHENPFNWGNHGFWNINPTLMYDFYEDNGFEVVACFLHNHRTGVLFEAPRLKRFKFLEAEVNLFTVAVKREEMEFSFPTQGKYRK